MVVPLFEGDAIVERGGDQFLVVGALDGAKGIIGFGFGVGPQATNVH